MMYILEGITTKFLTSPEREKVSEFLNKKVFKVADTPLTYRQINSLDSANLLVEDRENSKGWRKFSFKELTYVYIVSELKGFGLKHDQLDQLRDAFFKEHLPTPNKKLAEPEINKGMGEMVLGCVFGGVEITLCVDSAGQIVFYDPVNYSAFYQASKPQIHLNLNNVVNSLLSKFGYTQIPVINSVSDAVLNWNRVDLTTIEEKLMELIRDNDYSTIEVTKKDGKSHLVHAGKTITGKIKPREIIKMLEAKDFQTITVVKRDGEIVNYKIEETIKL